MAIIETQHNDHYPDEDGHKKNVAIVFGRTTVSSLHPD